MLVRDDRVCRIVVDHVGTFCCYYFRYFYVSASRNAQRSRAL